jgi:serine/threonine protein kinase
MVSERALMIRVGPHPCVGALLGTCQSVDTVGLVLEALHGGDLMSHLRFGDAVCMARTFGTGYGSPLFGVVRSMEAAFFIFCCRRMGHGFPEDIARFYVSEVACALSHAHSQGVAHRDVKSGPA